MNYEQFMSQLDEARRPLKPPSTADKEGTKNNHQGGKQERLPNEDAILNAIGLIPGAGKAIEKGARIGRWMQDNLDKNVSSSGRGAGRSSFS